MAKHKPLASGHTSGIFKDGRTVPFMSLPPAGRKWQVQNKVSTVRMRYVCRCARFDGSAIAGFLAVFRANNCVISGFFSGKGRAVQMWNSIRHLGASRRRRLRKELAQGRVVLRWNMNCAEVIANIDDLAISIWPLGVIDKLSQIDDI